VGGDLVGPRRTSEPQVDAAWMQGLQRAELLGDHQGRVVGQHDAARADADGRGRGRHMGQGHGGRGAGHADHVVVLRHPIAGIAQPLGMTGEFGGVSQRLPGVGAFHHGGEIEH